MLIHLRPNTEPRYFDEGHARARILGEVATGMYPGLPWSTVESQVCGDWQALRGDSKLSWNEVRNEAHAAWQVAKLEREGHLRDDMPVFRAA